MAIDHARLRALFDAIVELEPPARDHQLAVLTDDPALRAQVLRLLKRHDLSTSRATQVARRMDGLIAGLSGPEVGVGDRLGAWQLVGELGQGGMGAVFRAQRCDGQFEQVAAIKVLRGMPSPEALARLGAERQTLARLAHPHIARLFDGGSTPKGRPYLVMEHVEGVPLDAWIGAQSPGLVQRLALFRQICAAVAFAHAHLVVHCDLKPSNVLVDGDGRPVLLDFGISRLLGADWQSEQDGHAFTPHYASPELKANAGVGTATDVYSLGVMLDEMLPAAGPAELRAVVRKATAADPAQRYTTVAALADDLQRFLNQRPLRAVPDRWSYRARKLWQRRWPLLLGALVAIAVLAGFTWRLALERAAAVAAREQARTEALTATRAVEFLVSILTGADVTKGGSRETTVWTLLEAGRQRVAVELADQPAVHATLLAAIGNVYANLQERELARTILDEAIAIERTLDPPRPKQLATTLRHAAELAQNSGRIADALPLAREALALDELHAPPGSADLGRSATALALVLTASQQFAEAEKLYLRHLAIRQQLGEPQRDLASTWHNLGYNASMAGALDKAESFHRQALAAKLAGYGQTHVLTANTQHALGLVLVQLRRPAEARPLFEQSLATRIQLLGERSPGTLESRAELVYLECTAGRYRECQERNAMLLADSAASMGAGSALYARLLNNSASSLERMGDLMRARQHLEQALAIRTRLLPAGDLGIARVQANLGRVLLALDELDAARPLLEAARAVRVARLPPAHDERRLQTVLDAELTRRSGDLAGARALLDALPAEPPHGTPEVAARRWREQAWLEAAEGRTEAARASMLQAVAAQRAQVAADTAHPDITAAELVHAELLRAVGDVNAARQLSAVLRQRWASLQHAFTAQSFWSLRLARLESDLR